MPPKRKATRTTTSNESRPPKQQAQRAEESSTTMAASNCASVENEDFKYLTLLESGHIDALLRSSNREKHVTPGEPICLVLAPGGTPDRSSQRRIVLTKSEDQNGQKLHYVHIDSMGKITTMLILQTFFLI